MSEYEKHSMSEKNEEETLEENADETGGLTNRGICVFFYERIPG